MTGISCTNCLAMVKFYVVAASAERSLNFELLQKYTCVHTALEEHVSFCAPIRLKTASLPFNVIHSSWSYRAKRK